MRHEPPLPTLPRTPVLALALALSLAAFAAPLAAQDGGIELGARPDPVTLETLDGQPVDLGEVFGVRPVLLEFWATWCPVCRALDPAMKAARDEFGDRVEFLVVAAAVAQDQDGIRRHLERRPVFGRVLWDTRGRAARAFEAPGTGYVVILAADGTVAYTGEGADQDLVGALRGVLEGTR